MMHARDAFLADACRVLGLHVRELHPPPAARGLHRASEFGQHFEASYRPHILRALEHNQPVIAWRGWPGEFQLHWGRITHAAAGPVGFVGAVPSAAEGREADSWGDLSLVRPPTQVYVMEVMEPHVPDEVELWRGSLRHARAAMSSPEDERFGVVRGPLFFDLWVERLTSLNGAPAGKKRTRAIERHRQLAKSVIACHLSGEGFLADCEEFNDASIRKISADIREKLESVVEAIRGVLFKLNVFEQDASTESAAGITDSIQMARTVTESLQSMVPSFPDGS